MNYELDEIKDNINCLLENKKVQYNLCCGKYGFYFRDNLNKKDLSLNEVLLILNSK